MSAECRTQSAECKRGAQALPRMRGVDRSLSYKEPPVIAPSDSSDSSDDAAAAEFGLEVREDGVVQEKADAADNSVWLVMGALAFLLLMILLASFGHLK